MAGDFLKRDWQLPLDVFQAFRDDRPKHEKWELIDGVPVMMPPPTIAHQRISGNLYSYLKARLAEVKPEWAADYEIGLLLPDDDKFNPEPDLTVIDAVVRPDQIYADRFYMVAEILSGSDKPAVIATKLGYYQAHAPNLCVLLIRQDRVSVKIHERAAVGSWGERELSKPDEIMALPGIGGVCTVGQLYRGTHLDPDKNATPPSRS